MPSLVALFTADAEPFRKELQSSEKLTQTVGKKMQKSLSETALHLEQQVVAAKRAGVSFAVYETELIATRAQLAKVNAELAVNEVVSGKAAVTGSKFAVNWRAGLSEMIVLMREIGRGNWSRVPASFSILIQRMGLLKYLLSPVAIGIAALGAAFFVAYRYSKNLADSAQNLYDVLSGANTKVVNQANAMREAANEAQDFHHWLEKLGKSQESFVDGVEETIRVLREENRLKRQLAAERGASKSDLAKMDMEAAKAELAALDQAIINQQKLADREKQKAIDKEKDSNNPEFKARLAGAKQVADETAKILQEVQKKQPEIAERHRMAEFGAGLSPGEMGDPSKEKVNFEVDGKKFHMSLKEAQESFDAASKQADSLSARQKELDEATKDAKESADKNTRGVETLTQQRQRLANDIQLQAKYGGDVADGAGRAKFIRGNTSSLQQVGAYTSPATVTIVDKVSKIHSTLQGIHTTLKNQGRSGGHRQGGVKYG